MGDGEKEIIALAEKFFDAADDTGAITVTDFLENDADGEGALDAKRARKHVGAVVKFTRSGEDALASGFGDRARRSGIVKNGRDGARSQPDVLCDFFQRDDIFFGGFFTFHENTHDAARLRRKNSKASMKSAARVFLV